MSRIEEISEEKAVEIINQQILDVLLSICKEKFKKEKERWDKKPKWTSKIVKTKFKLNGKECVILPQDIGLSSDPWDQGFMESIQSDIAKELKKYGATDIYNLGFLD